MTYLEKWVALNLEMLEEVGLGMSFREDNSGATNQDEKRSVKCQVFLPLLLCDVLFVTFISYHFVLLMGEHH